MKDGTILDFVIIHPGDMNESHPKRWITHYWGIKIGKNAYFFQSSQEHKGVYNPQNVAQDTEWWASIKNE